MNTRNRYLELQPAELQASTELPLVVRETPIICTTVVVSEPVVGYVVRCACLQYAVTRLGEVFRLSRRGAIPESSSTAQRVLDAANAAIAALNARSRTESRLDA